MPVNNFDFEYYLFKDNTGNFCNQDFESIKADKIIGSDSLSVVKEENNLECNFGGVCLGNGGEIIKLVTIDSMNLDNIGFIHCDAQGSESFIFSRALETIKKNRPVILYENNKEYAQYLYNNVYKNYMCWREEATFDLKKYCMEKLNYSKCIDKFNGSIDTLLIP